MRQATASGRDTVRATRSIRDSTFAIIANGAHDSPPAGPFQDYLVANGARRVTMVVHPLAGEGDPRHENREVR